MLSMDLAILNPCLCPQTCGGALMTVQNCNRLRPMLVAMDTRFYFLVDRNITIGIS